MNKPVQPQRVRETAHPLFTSISRPFVITFLALAGFLYGYFTLSNSVIPHDGNKKDLIFESAEGDHYNFRVEKDRDSLFLKGKGHANPVLGYAKIPKQKFIFISNPPLLIWIILMSMMLSTALALLLPLCKCLADLVFEYRPGKLAWWSLGMMMGTFALILIPHLRSTDISNILTTFEISDSFEIILTDIGRAREIVYTTLAFAGFTIAVMYVGNSCIPNIETSVPYLGPELDKLSEDQLTSIDKENTKLMSVIQDVHKIKKYKYLRPFLTIYKLFNAQKIHSVLQERIPPPARPSVTQIARRYESMDRRLRFLLLSLALLIIYSVLTSATFQQVLSKAMYLNNGKNILLPSEYVYAYGLSFTVLLGIIYLPIDLHLRDQGKKIASKIRSEAGNDVQRLKDEKDLLILEGKESGLKNFSSVLAILSPVLGSAFTEFVKNISG